MTTQSPFFDEASDSESGSQQLVRIGVCPSCQQAVTHTHDQLLRSQGEMSLSYGSCLSCHTPVITLNVGRGVVHTSLGLPTDLTEPEIEKFWSVPTITEEGLLALHQHLHELHSTHYFTH